MLGLYRIEVFSMRKKNPIRAEEYSSWEKFLEQVSIYERGIDPYDYAYHKWEPGNNNWCKLELDEILITKSGDDFACLSRTV